MDGTCQLCERENLRLTKHHLIPKQKHNKKHKRDLGEALDNTVPMCRSCQSQIHAFFSNKQLAEKFNTIELLKAQPLVANWIVWIRKHG